MKKLISAVLVFSMIASVIMVPVTGLAAKKEFLVAQSFEDQITGGVPATGGTASGATKVAEQEAGKDKALQLSGVASDNVYYHTVTTSEKVVSMYADITYTGKNLYTEINIYNSGKTAFPVVFINEDGSLCTGDGRYCGSFPKNRETSLQVTYDAKHKMVSVFVGGKSIEANRYLGASAYDSVAGFGIKVKGTADTSCLVDNFAIYEGKQKIKAKDIPQAKYNTQSLVADTAPEADSSAEVLEEEDEFVGDAVYIYRTFDETDRPEFENITKSAKLNTITVEKSVFDGNKYVKIDKKEAEESYISFGANQTARYVVLQADFSTDKSTPAGKLFYTRDGEATSMFGTFLSYDTKGNVTTTTGVTIAKIEPLKWVNIAVALNLNDLTLSAYVDGKLAIKGVPFQNKTLTGAPLIRINCDKKANTGTLLVDNIKTYEGKEPREISANTRKTKRIPDTVPQGYLGMNKAISPYSSTYYTNKVKYDAEHKMILENDDTLCYVHEAELKKMFGDTATLKNPHSTQTGYYEALETAKANGFIVTSVETRLHIFSKASLPARITDARLMEVYRYMFNVRPTAEQILELYKNSENYQQHPRILIDGDKLAEIKELYKTDPLMQEWGANVIAEADVIMNERDYTYPITGSSMDEVNYSMDDIVNLCLAYHLTGNERYVGRTWRFLKVICELGNWNPGGYLDVGELSYITAVGYDWLYHQWTKEQREYLEEKLYEKGVKLTYDLYHGIYDNTTYIGNDGKVTDFYVGWYDSENNWNAVCNGGTMCGAMALLDIFPEESATLIENTLWALEYMMQSYYPEGAWEEGGGYWNYALGYVVRVISSLRNTFDTDFRLLQTPGLDGTGWYGSKLAGSTGQYTIGDTSGGNPSTAYGFWLAQEFDDPLLAAMRMQEFEKMGKTPGYNEMISYTPDLLQGSVEPPLDTFMEGMEVVALREAWYDTGATFVGASGGKNGRGHGHYDTGSFQVEMAGEKFILDSGAENYNAKGGYFTANRYHFYKSRPEGHNMYIINPRNDDLEYKGVVPGSRAEGKLVESKPRGAFATMDLTNVYSEWVSHAERGYMLSDDRRTVTVRDEIDLLEPNSEIYYSLHTRAKVEKLNDTQMLLTNNGKKMLVSLVTNGTDVVFEEAEAKTISNVTPTVVSDTNNTSQGLRKLVIKMKGTGRLNITLKFKQYDDMMVADYPEDINIANWSIPDGEVTPLPVLDGLYVDGELVEGFDPKITGYSYLVASKETAIPTVTAATSLKTEIIPATEFGGDTIVKVFAADNPGVYRAYRINFWKKAPLRDVDGMRRYPVAEATCIDSYELASPPDNAFDQDVGTRWASQSTDLAPEQWLMFELDDTYPIEKIGVSWMSGTARQYTYKLEISTDGVNWKTVFDGVSSGKTIDCEYTSIGGQMAKFVRYKGYGNTVNGWNSVTEVQILGNQR